MGQAQKPAPFDHAGVAKLVDAPDLGSGAARRGGSSPSTRTTLTQNDVPNVRECPDRLPLAFKAARLGQRVPQRFGRLRCCPEIKLGNQINQMTLHDIFRRRRVVPCDGVYEGMMRMAFA